MYTAIQCFFHLQFSLKNRIIYAEEINPCGVGQNRFYKAAYCERMDIYG